MIDKLVSLYDLMCYERDKGESVTKKWISTELYATMGAEHRVMYIYHKKPSSTLHTVICMMIKYDKCMYPYHEIHIDHNATFTKILLGTGKKFIKDFLKMSEYKLLPLWEMTEEEKFQFSLVDLEIDFEFIQELKSDIEASTEVLRENESYTIRFRTDMYKEHLKCL